MELAAIGADGNAAQSALAGLGLRDALLGEAPNAELTDRIIAAIREREALLILDNCEHVVESAAAFAHRLLGECQRLRILATSREPLGITGEALWLVEPLALPDGDASPDEIASSPAVQLLRERASALRKDLAVDARALSTMVRVCRALDGMPLAIELAAASLRTMSIDQLAHRLDDRFRLLTSGSRTALPRHKTLRAVVDWSWELLTDAERVVLRRLSVFSGGASLEAAEQVCAGDAVGPEQVLELLTALAEKSLLLTEGDSAPRYRMIATIKEYAAHRLAEAGETDLARRAHLTYFTELTETAEPHLRRAEQLEWLATLKVEHDNIGSAMRGVLAAGEANAAMRLAASASWYWWLAGHRAEGAELIISATKMPGVVSDDIRATVYALVVLFVTSGRGDQYQAEEWIHKAYRFSQHSQSRSTAPGVRRRRWNACCRHRTRSCPHSSSCWTTRTRGCARWPGCTSGRCGSCSARAGETQTLYLAMALAEFRALGELYGISFALTELADRIATRGEFAGACEHYEQAIAVVTEVGAIEDVIRMRSRQGQLYWLLGEQDSSAAAIADAERYAEQVTWPDALAELALSKAELARWDGNAGEARPPARRRDDHPGRRSGAGGHPRGSTRPARLPRRRSQRSPHAPRGGLPGGDRGGACAPDRKGPRRGRGPGPALRPVRPGRTASRRQRGRARTAGSFEPGCGPDRAGRAAPPRRDTVRRGDAGGHAGELACAGHCHARRSGTLAERGTRP